MQNIIDGLMNIERRAEDVLLSIERDRQSLSSVTTKMEEAINNTVNKQISIEIAKIESENKKDVSKKIKAIEDLVSVNMKKIKEKFYAEREDLIEKIFHKVIGGQIDGLQRSKCKD